MTDKPHRCQHCWSSLPEAVNDFCPHCHRSLGGKAPRRRWRAQPETATAPDTEAPAPAPARTPDEPPAPPASTPYEPPAPPPAHTRYEQYEPPAPPPPAHTPYQQYEPPAPPPPAHTLYEPYEPPAPPPPAHTPHQQYEPPAPPAPSYTPYEPYTPPAPPAPAPAAVAVLERDPAEFPGQPLPPDFFATLPERTRRAPRKLNLRVLIVIVVAGGGAIISALGESADRSAAVDSPARYLVAGACAEYRDFTTRMDRNPDDLDAFNDAVLWFQYNGDRFTEAARLDPELQPAADFLVWFNGMIESGFETILEVPQGEIDAREEPLTQTCYTGAGRA